MPNILQKEIFKKRQNKFGNAKKEFYVYIMKRIQTRTVKTAKQIQIVNRIKKRLERGDITQISKDSGFTKEYVGMVFSANQRFYNDKIIETAIGLLFERDKYRDKIGELLASQ